MLSQDYTSAPTGLPRPLDDGACIHLENCKIPFVDLTATDGTSVRLATLQGLTVVFCYPMTGQPGVSLPDGWDHIPGARGTASRAARSDLPEKLLEFVDWCLGCTPQACSYRNKHTDIAKLGARLYGLSSQTTAYQSEAAQRLHLPYPLLSDHQLMLANALKLPTFSIEVAGKLIKRLTLIIKDGVIVKCFYPVFPSDSDVHDVLQWLQAHAQ